MNMGWGWSMWAGLVLLVGLVSSSLSLADGVGAGDLCMVALSGAEDKQLDFYAMHATNFVKKYDAIPSEKELAAQAKVEIEDVREFLSGGDGPQTPFELVVAARELYPAVYDAYQKKAMPKWATFFRKQRRSANVAELSAILGINPEHFEAMYGTVDQIASRVLEAQPDLLAAVRKKVIREYASGCSQRRATLSLEDLAQDLETTAEVASSWFGTHPAALFENLQTLKLAAVEAHPNSFKYVEDRDIFTAEKKEKTMQALRSRKRAILTTAVAGVALDEGMMMTLRQMASKIDAEIFVLPANMEVFFLDPSLHTMEDVHILTEDHLLSPEVKLSTLEITPKMLRPTTGLHHRGRRGQLQFYGSPKQWVDTVATNGEDVPPHILVSTGAITQGSYRGGTAVSQRTNRLAEEDHILGAVILEKTTGENHLLPLPSHGYYHFRHIEYRQGREGVWGFSDLGKFYTADAVIKESGFNLSIEVHVGDTDQRVFENLRQVVKRIPLELVTVHDLFNGHSINDHESKNLVLRGKTYEAGRLDLERELRGTVAFLDTLLSLGRFDVIIDVSNHDEWLKRYLESGRWIHEAHNYKIASELNNVHAQGQSPLEYIIDKIAREQFGRDILKRVRFMRPGEELGFGARDEDVVEIGQHGDAGANGMRGSIDSAQRASGRSMSGHTHTYRRRNGVVQIGTMTYVRLGYNRRGATNWVQGVGVVGPDGSQQVVLFTDGEWFAAERGAPPPPEQFFFDGYPRIQSRPPFAGYGGSLDPTSAFGMPR